MYFYHRALVLFQTSSGEVSAAGSPSGTPIANQVPKYGTLIPNRIFVGGIAANVSMLFLALRLFTQGLVCCCPFTQCVLGKQHCL